MSDIFADMSFGGRLKAHRIEHGFTLRDFAEKIGMDPGNLSRLERSQLDPPDSYKKVEELCAKCRISDVSFLAALALQHHLGKLQERWKMTKIKTMKENEK